MNSFQGTCPLFVGGSSGMSKVTARLVLEEGGAVVLLGRRVDKLEASAVALLPEDKDMPLLPWIDPTSFNPGYLMRGMHLLPKRGDKPERQHTQDYWTEKDQWPAIDLDDPAFVYG
jgi:hypothetical protein